jgi:YNFM family putative membrane transporter
MTAVSVAYAGDRFRERDLPAVVGGIIGASVVGGLVGRVLAGAIAARLGWHAPFVAFAALTAAAALLLARGLVEAAATERRGLGEAWAGMLAHLRDPRLVGAYLVGGALFFGWIGIFTYLPYHLAAPPYALSTAAISSVYLVYAAGVVSSSLAGRLSGRVPPRRLIAIGLLVEAGGMAILLARPLPLLVVGLVVMVLGTFTAQAVAPAFVNVTARTAKGGASALYLTSYYVGGTLGSALPGLALQAAGWSGVVLSCAAAVGIAVAANALLCGRMPKGTAAR